MNLHALPAHKLKIDKSFVQRITEPRTDRAIIDSTLVRARKLGLETMAEGVETDAQWLALGRWRPRIWRSCCADAETLATPAAALA